MKIVKTYSQFADTIATFINDNGLAKDDVLAIVQKVDYELTLFYYAEAESKPKVRNFWGELKEQS